MRKREKERERESIKIQTDSVEIWMVVNFLIEIEISANHQTLIVRYGNDFSLSKSLI